MSDESPRIVINRMDYILPDGTAIQVYVGDELLTFEYDTDGRNGTCTIREEHFGALIAVLSDFKSEYEYGVRL